MNDKKAFAEVIDSSLTGWIAQSWSWDYFPPFGSLVSVNTKKRTLIGIVHQIKTGSMDPGRSPFAYQKTEEQLLAEQPQIFEFLKTTFSCLVLGYYEVGKIRYQLAPEPPKIHAFVQPLAQDLYKQFFCSNQFLHVLFGLSDQIINLDELLLAILSHLDNNQLLTESSIEKFIETFSLLNGNDYRRLKLFLQRVETVVTI